MPKSKHDDSVEVDFCVFGCDSLLCGYLPNDQIHAYLEKLAKQDVTKEHCASYEFSLNGFPYAKSFKKILIVRTRVRVDGDEVYSLSPLCSVRTAGGCFRKIKKGECKDPFIIENIGKVFWPDKYSKQR